MNENDQPPFTDTRPVITCHRGDDGYANTRRVLEALPERDLSGASVLVKPNAGRLAPPRSGINTSPEAVAAVLDYFLEHDCDVAVAESPITGVKALEALEQSGIAAEARRRSIALIDMDDEPPEVVAIEGGLVVGKLRVCAEARRRDLVVSVPVMKTHMHTQVSLAIKNMKGCLYRKQKVRLHQIPPLASRPGVKTLDLAIADMTRILLPHLSVVDGLVGLEGLGPSAGSPRKAGLALASFDPFAADAVAAALMGLAPDSVHHLRLSAEAHGAVIDPAALTLDPPEQLSWAVPFAPPPTAISVEYPRVSVIDKGSCSACLSTVMLFLKRYHEQVLDYFGEDEKLTIAIGSEVDDVPPGTLCVGNCMARHKAGSAFVPGCPPVASELFEAFLQSRDS